jgi:hypothetical protein
MALLFNVRTIIYGIKTQVGAVITPHAADDLQLVSTIRVKA